MPTDNEILTLAELHIYLKVPKSTLYALAQNGRIPAAKIGKHWRFRKAVIDAWMTSQEYQSLSGHRKQTTATPQNAL